jgi:hypothetical protein
MTQLRIHNLTEIEEVTGDEKLVLDNSSFSNALSLTLNKLATYVLSKTESVMHAETLYYNSIANADYIVGAPVHIQGIYVFVGISLDDAAIGEPMRVAYAGKCKVFVESGLDVTEGDYAIYNTITNKIAIGLGNEISNRVGIFLETSTSGEDRLVWVLLKL